MHVPEFVTLHAPETMVNRPLPAYPDGGRSALACALLGCTAGMQMA
jgi:hypothetical protein